MSNDCRYCGGRCRPEETGVFSRREFVGKLAAAAVLALLAQMAWGVGGEQPLPGALAVIDLASDTAWTLSADGGPARPIKVPRGGWNSDWQKPRIDTMTGVKDYVVYERKILVPKIAEGQVTKISFGAVNYGAEVFVNDKWVGSHVGSLTPFEMAITGALRIFGPDVTIYKMLAPFEWKVTGAVEPGEECTLKVKAYHRRHYMQSGVSSEITNAAGRGPKTYSVCTLPLSIDNPPGADKENWKGVWWGQDRFAYGITKHVKLVVYPAVYIEDLFVKPSVSRDSLTVVVSVRNSTTAEKPLVLSGRFSSWNRDAGQYPAIPDTTLVVPAGKAKQVVVGPIKWGLGTESYWWPNIPFREDYVATLHNLVLDVKEAGKTWQTYTQRFGFCEHSEGPYYYQINGVRVLQVGDVTTESQIGYYDAYATLPAFLPPTGPGTGCPETWRRYMHCGINSIRVPCGLPTEYMMQAADEMGFMLMPEAVTFGNNFSLYHAIYHPQTVQEMGRLCRNHASVMRYSLANEVSEFFDATSPWPLLIDAMLEVDDTRPLVFDMAGAPGYKIQGVNGGHAYAGSHYGPVIKNPGETIYNMGECFTGTDYMAEFGVSAMQMRLYDWAYFAPWCWLNYWPNFFQGIDSDKHVQKHFNCIDRQDNVNGWGSPVLDIVQRGLHPYLLLDVAILEDNLLPKLTSWHAIGQGNVEWPRHLPSYAAGETAERRIEVFNGGLSGSKLSLTWAGHWDSPAGPLAIAGEILGPLEIQPGFHATQAISFAVPATDKDQRRLYLVLESIKDGAVVYTEDRIYFSVTSPKGLEEVH